VTDLGSSLNPGRDLSQALRANALNRWLVFVVFGSIVGTVIGAVLGHDVAHLVVYSAILGAALANPLILVSLGFFERRTKAASIVVRWYRSQSNTDADRAIDRGDVAAAEASLGAMSVGTPWEAFQARRIRARISGMTWGTEGVVEELTSAKRGLEGFDLDRAETVVAVFRAQIVAATGGDWIGLLAPYNPLVAADCPPLPRPPQRGVIRFVALQALLGAAIAAGSALLVCLLGYRPS
jgi:hypothetical protein